MSFKELKEEIAKAPNKKDLYEQFSIIVKDQFKIISALYSNSINCDNVSTVADIYKIANTYQLDKELFNKPFYITVILEDFDESTINIINQLDSSIYVQIESRTNVDYKKAQVLSKINHERCQFYCNGWVSQRAFEMILAKFPFDEESNPVLVIDEINFNTIKTIQLFCSIVKSPSFRIEIKDANSLQNLETIIPYISKDDILVVIDDDLFNEKRPNNARNLIVQGHDSIALQDKKLTIYFNDIKYESIDQIYELEKYLEIIKSHIPANASDLDIVTYVSLFVINYFKYDYGLLEEEKKENFVDMNLPQFISKGKGVCRHFASFTKSLLNSLGVECELINVDGDPNNPEELGHAFNAVKIDEKWYFLDNTWLAGRMQTGEIHSLGESSDFLTSNADFAHKEYEDDLEAYECETYNRDEIEVSVNRVLDWNQNYKIHLSALKDLFRKYILKKVMSVDDKIERAIPRRH